jgi:hypothetical protein
MPVLENYQQFQGYHWETGSVRNYFDYLGVKAPHTGKPYTEALFMGVNGGIVLGYFSFAYEGYDPQCRILTRNTFNHMDTYLSRLGVTQHIRQTAKPEKATRYLIEALEDGSPAIVWADSYSLPYAVSLPYADGMWMMMPILVYGYDQNLDQVWIADRAQVPLNITTSELSAARGRIKKEKHRLVTYEPPDPDKLPGAVTKGIWDCIKLFTDAPPKGSRNNFGLQAYRWWIKSLTNPNERKSWAKEFPPGPKMYAALKGVYTDVNLFGNIGSAERNIYASFLQEAAVILGKPALNSVAELFQTSADAWDQLSQIVLSDDIPLLGKTRQCLVEQQRLFLVYGMEKIEKIRTIQEELKVLRQEAELKFSLELKEAAAFRENIAGQLQKILGIETEAVSALQEALA